MDWIIYLLRNPRTREACYVGVTNGRIESRLREHVNDSLRTQHTPKQRGIVYLLSIGLYPTIEVIESGCGRFKEAEQRWIVFHRHNGARLWNAIAGGGAGWRTPRSRSVSARKRVAGMTLYQRYEIVRASARLTHEERSEIAKRTQAARTPEQRSAIARARDANMTPEQRSQRATNGARSMTPEQRKKATAKWRVSMTSEILAGAAKRLNSRTTQQRSESAKNMWAARRAAS